MREKELSTRVIFVRHGKTDFPHDRIYCDDVEDPALNDEGLAQARAAAHLLQNQAIDIIYCSPSMRTLMTAAEIVQVSDVSVIEQVELRERRFGIWDGLYFEDIASRYPDDYQAWKRDPIGYTPEGGETVQALARRVRVAIGEVVQQHTGKTALIVSHVGPIRVALAEALMIPLERYRQLTIDYASLTRVDYGHSQNNLIFANFGGQHLRM